MSVTLTITPTYSSEAHSDDACFVDHLDAVPHVLRRRRHRHHGCFRANHRDENLGELLAQHGLHGAHLGTRGERRVPPLKRFVRSFQMNSMESAPQSSFRCGLEPRLDREPAGEVREAGGHSMYI